MGDSVSASAKLQELDAEIRLPVDQRQHGHYAPNTVLLALPEIIALVDAAELTAPIFSVAARQAGINRTPVAMLEAALAVLEAKLAS